MSSVSTIDVDDPAIGEYEPYRAVSKGAILSIILGLLSITAFSLPALAVLALVGFVFGWNAYRNIRRYPTELSGKWIAVLGTTLCGVLFASAVTMHSVTYATEVPEGYQRVSFSELQPMPQHPELPVSPTALEMNHKKVFIKGYIYPDGQQANIKRFVLVPDMGTCCFGGQPKLTHMLEVTLTDPDRVKYSLKKRKLAGTALRLFRPTVCRYSRGERTRPNRSPYMKTHSVMRSMTYKSYFRGAKGDNGIISEQNVL